MFLCFCEQAEWPNFLPVQVRAPAKGVFLRAFHAAYGRYFWVTGIFQGVNTLLMFANPLLINILVQYLAGEIKLSPTAAVRLHPCSWFNIHYYPRSPYVTEPIASCSQTRC